jgi:hypothetical protein
MHPSDIRADSPIEAVVESHPSAVQYLSDRHGLNVLCCGVPVWATLQQLATRHGLEPAALVESLRAHLAAA